MLDIDYHVVEVRIINSLSFCFHGSVATIKVPAYLFLVWNQALLQNLACIIIHAIIFFAFISKREVRTLGASMQHSSYKDKENGVPCNVCLNFSRSFVCVRKAVLSTIFFVEDSHRFITFCKFEHNHLTCSSSAHSATFPSLHLSHSSFSNPSVALPTSQLILQPFRRFTYVTVHSPALLSLLLRHKLFI